MELQDTVLEGIRHMRLKFSKAEHDAGYSMLVDVLNSISSIDDSMRSFAILLEENKIDDYLGNVKNSLELLFQTNIQSKPDMAESLVKDSLEPSFILWKNETKRCFNGYMLS